MNTQTLIQIQKAVLQRITSQQAWQYQIIPKIEKDGILELYTTNESKSKALINEIEIVLGTKIKLIASSEEEIKQALLTYYRISKESTDSKVKELHQGDDFLAKLIGEAKEFDSSDIHIESYDDGSRVRFRIDGRLVERYRINKSEYPFLVNKIKVQARLDISEKRLPQDGRILFNSNGKKIDLRVSILPTLNGEKVVLRLLNKDASNLQIEKLGMSSIDLKNYLESIKKTNGLVLISGPTGSGKTTTLYATLKLLNKETVNILSIEDPIEYTLTGINQVQLKESIGLTFAGTLRTFLRQDPDIIMVGEIRDQETAQMAIRAALTGHLVLSTVHTNSAWGSLNRLLDLGVPAYLLANTVNLCVAQRLIRLLCPYCKIKEQYKDEILPTNFQKVIEVESHYIAKGCDRCFYSGYSGRKAVFEVIPVDLYLSEKIKQHDFNIVEYLSEKNIKSLRENILELIVEGLTSIEEAYPHLINN